jgi:hypothetical protein
MVTFAASTEDAFTLNEAAAGVIKNAQVRGSPIVMRSLLGYVAASRAANGDKAAFMDATKYLVSNMLRSMAKKLEIEMLYGQVGYGVIHAKAGGSPEDFGSTTLGANQIAIKKAEWAPGIWAGAEGLPLEITDVAGTTIVQTVKVTAVDLEKRIITLDAAPVVAVVADSVLFHKGTTDSVPGDKEFAGIHKILTTTTGLFGIPSSYTMFKGNSYSANVGSSAALSFTKLNLAAARAVEKGLDGKLVALVNPRAWANLLNDQAATRKLDQSYSPAKSENGSKSITFYSQNGEIEIVPSIYVKEGYSYLLATDEWMRIGSQDVSFKRPGAEGEFFRDLEGAAAYELRLYSDQAIFCMAPGKNVLITDIENDL